MIFSGETLWVTDATVLAASTEANLQGQSWADGVRRRRTDRGSIAGGV